MTSRLFANARRKILTKKKEKKLYIQQCSVKKRRVRVSIFQTCEKIYTVFIVLLLSSLLDDLKNQKYPFFHTTERSLKDSNLMAISRQYSDKK